MDADGAVLGRHDGAFAFTIGQRRGTGVAMGERRYVTDVDPVANRVVVGPGELLERRGLVADRCRGSPARRPDDGPFEAEVRIRYRGADVPCVAEASVRPGPVEFRSPQRAVAPGRAPSCTAATRSSAGPDRRGDPVRGRR